MVSGGLAEKEGDKKRGTCVPHTRQPGQHHLLTSVTNLSWFAQDILFLALKVLCAGKPGQLATPLSAPALPGASLCPLRRTLKILSVLDTKVSSEMTTSTYIAPHQESTATWRGLQVIQTDEKTEWQ